MAAPVDGDQRSLRSRPFLVKRPRDELLAGPALARGQEPEHRRPLPLEQGIELRHLGTRPDEIVERLAVGNRASQARHLVLQAKRRHSPFGSRERADSISKGLSVRKSYAPARIALDGRLHRAKGGDQNHRQSRSRLDYARHKIIPGAPFMLMSVTTAVEVFLGSGDPGSEAVVSRGHAPGCRLASRASSNGAHRRIVIHRPGHGLHFWACSKEETRKTRPAFRWAVSTVIQPRWSCTMPWTNRQAEPRAVAGWFRWKKGSEDVGAEHRQGCPCPYSSNFGCGRSCPCGSVWRASTSTR